MKTRNFGDWIIALCVIVSSAVLFVALALALSGKAFERPGRHMTVYFHEATGIAASSQVRYGGAQAGRVDALRMLTPQERLTSGDPMNTVQVTLALAPGTPPFPEDVTATIQSDTVLSDKFVEIAGGNPSRAALADNGTIQGISPVTFDELSSTLENVLTSVQKVIGGAMGSGGGAVLARLGDILDQAAKAVMQASVLMQDAHTLVQTGNSLIDSNQARIQDTITRLNNASVKIESLSTNGDTLLKKNQGAINTSVTDLRGILQNLKVTTTYSKYFFNDLYQRPQRLLWGGTPGRALPEERQIILDDMRLVPGRQAVPHSTP